MGRKPSNRREQSTKGREVSLSVRRVQGLRFSNAAGPHMSGARYDRAEFRNAMQRGQYDLDD